MQSSASARPFGTTCAIVSVSGGEKRLRYRSELRVWSPGGALMASSVFGADVTRIFAAARTGSARKITVEGREVEIGTPFPSPEDWRDRWIYFLLVDRFNNPDAPPRTVW